MAEHPPSAWLDEIGPPGDLKREAAAKMYQQLYTAINEAGQRLLFDPPPEERVRAQEALAAQLKALLATAPPLLTHTCTFDPTKQTPDRIVGDITISGPRDVLHRLFPNLVSPEPDPPQYELHLVI